MPITYPIKNAILMGILVLTIYLLCLPFISRTWRATGDEPHYLLAAHSLVVDGDFDLGNNYEGFDYLAFYVSRDISRQVRVDGAGREVLNHYPALAVVVAPAYALGGRWGVLLFQVLLGGLLAVVTFRLAWVVSEDMLGAVVGTGSVMLTAPLFLYHYLVYPEMIVALLTTFVLYYAVYKTQPSIFTKLLVWGALLSLPWFNRRFVVLAF